MKCPCCGGDMNVNLPVVYLNRNTVTWDGCEIKVWPRTAEILHLLVEAAPNPLPVEGLITRVLGIDHKSEHPDSLIHQHVAEARKAIAPLGWAIRCVSQRGYTLERVG